MAKTHVNEQEYSRLINEKMKEHPEYKENMRVELTPEGTNKPAGLHIIGGNDANSVVAWAQSKVSEEYNLIVTR